MSIYSALSISVPTINYSVLHQVRKGVETKEYVKTIHEMHAMVRAESEKVAEVWKNHVAELTASSIQSTRGSLSQFLTLPLQSDFKEVHKILEDQVNQVLGKALPSSKIGVVASTEGRFVWEVEQNGVLQSFLTRGKEYLKKLKFRTADPVSHIFESGFVVEGGLNLDIVEHIVRDRMGIYATAHGQHIRESDPFIFAAHNLAFLQGNFERGESKYEAVIHFSKGKVQYAPYRSELTELVQTAQAEFKLHHCSIWQRKLGLGAGTEFNLRLRSGDRKALREFILHLAKAKDKTLVYDPLFKNGHLLVKELTE